MSRRDDQNERRREIVERLHLADEALRVWELAARLGRTVAAVARDVDALEAAGRVHTWGRHGAAGDTWVAVSTA